MIDQKQQMLDWYNDSLDKYGEEDYRSLTWGDTEGRSAAYRYKIIDSIVSLNDKRVLEVGCGWGSIFDFGFDPKDYLGLDINENLIRIARSKHPNKIFIHEEISEISCVPKYDVCIASGVAGNRGGPAWHPDLLDKFLDDALHCAELVVINFPSIWANIRSEHVEYFAPEQVFAAAVRKNRNVQLHHFENFDFFLTIGKTHNESINTSA